MKRTPKASKAKGLTYWEARGIYRKVIGGRCFYFGADLDAAATEAAAIKAAWRAAKSQGHSTWPQGQPNRLAIQQALGFSTEPDLSPALAAAIGMGQSVTKSTTGEELVSPSALTLKDAANIYFDEIAKSDAGERWRKDVEFRLGKALDSLGRQKPMSTIGQLELVNFAAHWRARPFKKNQDGTTSKERLGWLYASRIVSAAKSFFAWAADHPQICWAKPPRFDSLLLLKADKPKTVAEREVAKAKAWQEDERFFDLRQLRALYQAADSQFRAFILLGLNCAYGPSEIAALTFSDIRRNGSTWIQTLRPKTGEKSKHYLWAETVDAIENAMAKPNKAGLVFLTEKGKPVASAKYNSFPHAWDELRKTAKVPDAPAFKALRKTSANAIRKIGGETVKGDEIADVHLAHAESLKMIGPYADRLWEEHRMATKKLRAAFKSVWA